MASSSLSASSIGAERSASVKRINSPRASSTPRRTLNPLPRLGSLRKTRMVAKVADGNHHPTALRELVLEDLGDPRGGGGHEDGVVRRGGCVALAAVSPDHLDPVVAESGEPRPRQLRQPEVPFHRVDLRPEA